MAISTNGVVVTRFAAAVYNQQLSNATYNEVVTWANTNDLNNLLNAVYTRDFATIADSTVANTIVTNLGLTAVEGLANWLAAQITAAGTGKGAAIANILNGFAQMTSDATYGSAATTFNTKVDNAQALSQTSGNTGGNFSDVGSAVAGKTFTLTTAANNFTGGSGDDTFDGSLSSGNMTFGAADQLDGGAGTDTLTVQINAAGTYQATKLASIENINLIDTNGSTLSLLGATGVSKVTSSGSTAATTVSGISSTSIGLGVSNSAVGATFTFTDSAVSGTADTATLTLSGQTGGTNVIAGIETLNIVSSGSANTVATMTTAAATKFVVTGTQNLTVTNNLGATVVNVDASAATGSVDVDFGAGAVTATGGAGNDVFSFEAAGNVSAVGGAGNDTFQFDATGTITADDTVDGGAGTADVLESSAAEAEAIAATLTKVTNIEVVKLTGAGTAGATLDAADFGSGVNKVILGAGTGNGTYTINFNAGASSLDLTGAIGAGVDADVTLTATGTGTSDSLTITYKSATADIAEDLVTTGIETLTINNTDGTADTFGNLTMTASTGGTTKLVLQGNKTFTGSADSYTVNVIDASALTGSAAFVMGAAAAAGLTSITGSANADTLIGDASSSIDGGAGNDAITGGANNDTLIGGTGNDTITSAAGNDSINGGTGDDRIVMGDNLTTGDVIDGGDGTDTLSVTSATTTGTLNVLNGLGISAVTALNNNISNIERLLISDALVIDGTNFDMARIDSINHVTFGGALGTAAETIVGIGANSTFVLTTATAGTGNETTLTLADSSGTSDAINFTLTNDTDNTDFGNITVSGIETINIATAETTSAANTAQFTFDLTTTGATSIVITGTEGLTLAGKNQSAATIDASALAGNLTVSGSATGSSMTITGGTGADTITGGVAADSITGGTGADSLVGGAGADTLSGGAGGDTVNGGAGNDTIDLGAGDLAADTYVFSGTAGTSNIDTISNFNAGATAGDIFDATGLAAFIGTTTEAVLNVTTTTTAGAANDNILLLNFGAYYADAAAVASALASGGAITLGSGITGATAHVLVAYQASAGGAVRIAEATVADAGGFDAVTDLAVLTGVTTITSLVAANFTTD